jgi:hypothetical protein
MSAADPELLAHVEHLVDHGDARPGHLMEQSLGSRYAPGARGGSIVTQWVDKS